MTRVSAPTVNRLLRWLAVIGGAVLLLLVSTEPATRAFAYDLTLKDALARSSPTACTTLAELSGSARLTSVGGSSASSAASGVATEDTTAVIGRQVDTEIAKDWAGHEVLDLPAEEWSIPKNDAWVRSVIDRKMDVYVGSNPTFENLWDPTAGRSTVFGRELNQFLDAGYTWDGWTLRAPGG